MINSDKENILNDLSDLLNIKNVNGDEAFTQDGNKLVWTSNGSDIYYQGESSKDLPVECSIKYELDGKEISAKDLAGKSGKVKIIIEYTNKDAHTVNINGINTTLYTPFVAVLGTIINNDINRNIQITNGKVIDDGSKAIVIGFAMPGMQESLNISKSKFDIPNQIEITMDSTDFELGNLVTYVTPKIIEDDDLDIFDDLDKLYGSINTLQSSANELENGTKELKIGSEQLSSGATELKTGISSAYSGANQIKSEISKATRALQSDKTDALDEKTLNMIKEQAAANATLSNEQKQLIVAQAVANATLSDEQKSQITAQAQASSVLTAEQKAQITAGAQANAVLSDAQKQAIIANATQSAGPLTERETALLIQTAQMTATQTAVTTALNTAQTIATQTAVQTALATAQTTASQTAKQTAVATAQTTAKQVAEETAVTTAKQVGNQAKQTFTKQVVSQMSTLEGGLNQLSNGLYSLNTGASALSDGTSTLDEGISTLSDGMSKFNKEGIQTICRYINKDLKDVSARIEKLQDLANKYDNFTALADNSNGNTKFIMMTDSIKKKEEN